MPVTTPPRFKIKIAVLIAAILLVLSACLLTFVLFLPGILRGFEPKITHEYDDRYATDGKHVYYMDNGYKKVEGADLATFRSLYDKNVEGPNSVYGHWGCIAGRDKNAVFIGRTRIETLNPEKTRILSGRYIADGTLVYYRDGALLPNADPATLDYIIGHYARDKNTLYYKAAPIPEADLADLNYVTEKPLQGGPGVAADLIGSFRSVDSSRKDGNYLKDGKNVYFKGIAVPGADPDTFRVLYVEGDQWQLTYAEDKTGYYFNGRPLPSTIAGTGEKLEPGSLRLLQADRNFGWAELFYANASVYAFNTKEEKLEHVFTRKTSAPFTRITRGVYADDRNVFFSACREKMGRRKNGRFLISRSVYLQPLQGVSPVNFIKVGTIEGPPSRKEGEIFEADGVRYFHPRFVDTGAALTYLKSDGSGLSPEDYSAHAFRSRMKGDVMEPLGLEHIPLQDEFAHVTDYRSFTRRYAKWLWPLAILVAVLVGIIGDRAVKAKRKKDNQKIISTH